MWKRRMLMAHAANIVCYRCYCAMHRRTVLITGARAPVALELARSFDNGGANVIVADTHGAALARWSRSVRRFVRIPSPVHAFDAFASTLDRIVQEHGVDDVIPTCEETFYVSMLRDSLPCRTWVMDIDTLRAVHDKWTFSQHPVFNAHVPETVRLTDFHDWDATVNYVFKPRFSRFAARAVIGRHVRSADFANSEDWIAQRRIIGREVCVYSVWRHGTMTAIAIYHPRYRAGQGAGIYLEAVHDDRITSMVRDAGQRMGFHGQLSLDVIIDATTEQPYVIECNPRATSGAHLLGDALADAFTSDVFVQPPVDAEYAIWYAMALYHPAAMLKRRNRRACDVVFRRADALPALMQGLGALHFAASAWRNKCSILEATTRDIEWNG
ncbi:MAG: ATP-grasp domain-containing protein [Candidatus Kapabacteria bacterium]|nr:ATP-grasp domain-containing protein [Candidatus Kapabacteria bacterium]